MLLPTQLHFTRPQQDQWRQVALSAAAVLGVTQRSSGLWPYPTCEEEVGHYHGGGNDVAFGEADYGSYTVTWYALVALEELYGGCPRVYIDNVKRAFLQNPAIGGAYGRPERSGGRTTNKVLLAARHTAFALLIRLRYLPNYSPEDWRNTVTWILEKQKEGEKGGWTYRDDRPDEEPLATAACVAALAYYLHVSGSTLSAEDRTSIIQRAYRGLQCLSKLREESGLWQGHLSGLNDITESANIIDLLLLPEIHEQLKTIDPEFDQFMRALQRALKKNARSGAWPASWREGAEPSVTTTISATHAAFSKLATSTDEMERAFLYGACEYIVEQLAHHKDDSRLFSGDWTILARLSAAVVTSSAGQLLSEAERHDLARQLKIISRGKRLPLKIFKLAAFNFPDFAVGPIVFVLSKGNPNSAGFVLQVARNTMRFWPYAKNQLTKYFLKELKAGT